MITVALANVSHGAQRLVTMSLGAARVLHTLRKKSVCDGVRAFSNCAGALVLVASARVVIRALVLALVPAVSAVTMTFLLVQPV